MFRQVTDVPGMPPVTPSSATATSIPAWPKVDITADGSSHSGNLRWPRQLNTPHGIAADAQGNVYVSEPRRFPHRSLRRRGQYLRQIKIDVPFDYAKEVAAMAPNRF